MCKNDQLLQLVIISLILLTFMFNSRVILLEKKMLITLSDKGVDSWELQMHLIFLFQIS